MNILLKVALVNKLTNSKEIYVEGKEQRETGK
jgi:hypothetical protein